MLRKPSGLFLINDSRAKACPPLKVLQDMALDGFISIKRVTYSGSSAASYSYHF